jgi:hypothetical protein
VSVELYNRLPHGTVLQGISGEQYIKGQGQLTEAPDFRYYGPHRITGVGFPARQHDPAGFFMASYREE